MPPCTSILLIFTRTDIWRELTAGWFLVTGLWQVTWTLCSVASILASAVIVFNKKRINSQLEVKLWCFRKPHHVKYNFMCMWLTYLIAMLPSSLACFLKEFSDVLQQLTSNHSLPLWLYHVWYLSFDRFHRLQQSRVGRTKANKGVEWQYQLRSAHLISYQQLSWDRIII